MGGLSKEKERTKKSGEKRPTGSNGKNNKSSHNGRVTNYWPHPYKRETRGRSSGNMQDEWLRLGQYKFNTISFILCQIH